MSSDCRSTCTLLVSAGSSAWINWNRTLVPTVGDVRTWNSRVNGSPAPVSASRAGMPPRPGGPISMVLVLMKLPAPLATKPVMPPLEAMAPLRIRDASGIMGLCFL